MKKDIINLVLEFEKRGVDLYLELAAKTEDAMSKKLFYSLAEQEVQHASRADFFEASLDTEHRDSQVSSIESIEEELQNLFNKLREGASASETNLDGYKRAMRLEKEGYKIYSDLYEKTGDAEEKNLLEFLLKEEKSHIDAISNVYSYLTDTSDWLEENESKVWNWMSI